MQTRARGAAACRAVRSPTSTRKRRGGKGSLSPSTRASSTSTASLTSSGRKRSEGSLLSRSFSSQLSVGQGPCTCREGQATHWTVLDKPLRRCGHFLQKAATALVVGGLVCILLKKIESSSPGDLNAAEKLLVTSFFVYWFMFVLPDAVTSIDLAFVWRILGIVSRLWAPEIILRLYMKLRSVSHRKQEQTTLENILLSSSALRSCAVVAAIVIGFIPALSRPLRHFFGSTEKERTAR